MKIKYVTMTGADDNTSVEGMAELSEQFEFAEWGILFSQTKAGTDRYPSFNWIEELWDGPKMRLCAHLCGKWVSDVMTLGKITFLNSDESEIFHRVQLNMGKECLADALGANEKTHKLLWDAIDCCHVILGGNYPEVEMKMDIRRFFMSEVCPLFDASGGRGANPTEWPSPYVVNDMPLFCGFAGGLSPKNLEQELLRIEKACQVEARQEPEIWIDAESGLRNKKGNFDLKKCEEFLKMAKPWTG